MTQNIYKFLLKRYVVITPILLVLVVAQIESYSQLTTSGTFGAAIRLAIPIMLAGLGGLYSEKTGVVNIGLDSFSHYWAGFPSQVQNDFRRLGIRFWGSYYRRSRS